MNGALKFKNPVVAKQPNEKARLRVLGGTDHGSTFVLTTDRVTLGRGEDNEVILSDLKVSRKHAEIQIIGNTATIRDLGSSHGLMVNGSFQKQCPLKTGDKIGLGSSVIEFIGQDALNSPVKLLPPSTVAEVGTGDSGMTKFIPRSQVNGKKPTTSGNQVAGGSPTIFEKNKKVIMILGGLLILAALLPEVEQKQKAKKNKYLEPQEIEAERLSGLRPPAVDPKTVKQADVYFKEGFREFRAMNYLRAQVAFETALQIYGDHALARIYLESTKKAMTDEAQEYFKTAKRDEEANRLREAMINYESIKRLFLKDQSNPLYKEAEKLAVDLQKRMDDAEK